MSMLSKHATALGKTQDYTTTVTAIVVSEDTHGAPPHLVSPKYVELEHVDNAYAAAAKRAAAGNAELK